MGNGNGKCGAQPCEIDIYIIQRGINGVWRRRILNRMIVAVMSTKADRL